MTEVLKNIYEAITLFDSIYLIISILSLIKCSRKGFILSVLAASKWLLAYVITLIIFPKVKPYAEDIIDNEYILDIFLGVGIFALVIFIILMINKGIGKAVSYSGLGSLDSIFGLFFGFIRGYVVCVCLFAAIDIVYNYNKWPINTDKSIIFPWIEKHSIYLIKVFPNEKNYQDSKEKIEEL